MTRLIRQGYSWSGRERHAAFLNGDHGRFFEVAPALGFAFQDDGRALARIDWDQDGDEDLLLTSRGGPRLRLLINEQRTPNHWLAIQLEGSGANRDALGARVEVHLAGREGAPLIATRRAGEGFLAQSSAWLTFGLLQGEVERVVVRWPAGAAETFTGLHHGGRYRLVQGAGEPALVPGPPRPQELAPNPPSPAARQVDSSARIVLPAALPLPTLQVETPEGRRAALFGRKDGQPVGAGRPLVILLWASWCAPCSRELGEILERADDLREQGVDVLALSLDQGPDRTRAASLLQRWEWPFASAFAPPETIEVLDALQGALRDSEERIALPASLLVDGEGGLVAFYLGAISTDTLLADRGLIGLEPHALRDAAVPFAGRWLDDPRPPDLGFFERRFARRGLPGAARELHMGQVDTRRLSEAQLLHQIGTARARQGDTRAALEQFRRAVELDAHLFEARRDLAIVLHQLGQLEQAIIEYRAALRLAPADAMTHFNLGVALLAADDLPGAIAQQAELERLGSPLAEDLAARLARAER